MQTIYHPYHKEISDVVDQITKAFFSADIKTIFHYTSPSGLKGIIEKKALWFTKSSYLNDLTETNYINEVIQDILSEQVYSRAFCSYIEQDCLENFHSKESTAQGYEYYICSFSKAKDELSLWNYYTKSPSKAGYNLGIKTSELMRSISDETVGLSFRFGEVIYSYKEQKRIVVEILDKLYQVFNKIDKKGIIYGDEFLPIKNNLYDILALLAPFFKHPAFKNEKECRVVCSVYPTQDIMNLSRIREQNGIFVPYLEIPICKEMVRTIGTSPYIIAMNVEDSVYELCKQNAYDIRCVKSDIPIRKE